MATENDKLAVFLYFDADDATLEKDICQNVLDVTSAALSDNVEIYIYLDRLGQDTRVKGKSGMFDDVYDEWQSSGNVQGGSMYGKVVKQGDGSFKVEWDAATGLTVRDSSLPSTFSDFMTWATDQTDASHYLVWMSDHGNGLSGGFTDAAISENIMLPMQYAGVLKAYSDKLGVVTFDCCLMADAEALAELNGVAKYVVASEQLIGGDGMDYKSVFTAISDLQEWEAETLATMILDADTTTKSKASTLSVSKRDGQLLSALQEFGKASSAFTAEDWSALVNAFHNPNYYYSRSYVDLIALLQDPALTGETVSQNLNDAVSALKAAAEASVVDRKTATGTVQTQHGYGVMVYAPVRQQTAKNVKKNYAYMSMLQAGNDTPWASFLYKLYEKAAAADKVYRSLESGTPVNQNPAGSAGLLVDETGYLVHDSEDDLGAAVSLTDNGLKQSCNYVLNQEAFLVFDTKYATNTYTMKFTFKRVLTSTSDEVEKNSITIKEYNATGNKLLETYTLGDLVQTYTNSEDAASITVEVTFDAETPTHVWQIISEKAVSYSMEGSHLDAEGQAVRATEDRFDREYNQEKKAEGYHSADNALSFTTNYIGALAVTADTSNTVNSDWFKIDEKKIELPSNLEITVTGMKTESAVTKGALTVELWRKNAKEELVLVSTAVEAKVGKYAFSGVTFQNGDYLKVSSQSGEDACYYDVNLVYAPADANAETGSENVTGYPKGCIDSTSTRAIPEKSGSYALFWSSGHNVTADGYQLQISDDRFNTAFSIQVDNIAAKIYNVDDDGSYDWRVKTLGKKVAADWKDGSDQLTGEVSEAPRRVTAQNDYVSDIMMAGADGIWQSGYIARNCGFTGTDWTGTREAVSITGKNKITDVFTGGGSDSAILVLTDDANGDAAFVDDIYSALPDDMTAGSRLTNITTVYAGAGDDVVDFTSQRYSSQTVEKMVLHGGDGNDVLWTANTASWLFGDAGNDKLSGSTKNDVLVGGSGDDTMYGCGGEEDIFCFCENWGIDTVFQEADSKVVLWFAKGKEENWDADTLTYSDGDNSVKVSGVTDDDITLRFGREQKYADAYDKLAEAGAFLAKTTSKIYESTLA